MIWSVVAERKQGVEVKEILRPWRKGGRKLDVEVPRELVPLHPAGLWEIGMWNTEWCCWDPSPVPVASFCLHQVFWLFLLPWYSKSRQQGQGFFAVPIGLLPWTAAYLDHEESQAKLKSGKTAAKTILCCCINIVVHNIFI